MVTSGDQRPTRACADQASENCACGESVPVGVDGGSANEKPGKPLLCVF